MTDHDGALRLDNFLDSRSDGNATSEPLAAIAASLQQLDDQQRAIPSDAYRAQLWQTLFGSSNGTYTLTTADESAVLSPSRPTPRKRVQPKKSRRIFDVAAAVLVLIIGLGVVIRLPIGSNREPEPSAIPAAAMADASPTQAIEDAYGTPLVDEGAVPTAPVPLVVVNDVVFYFGTADGFPGLVANRTADSKRLWMVSGAPTGELVADDRAVYVSFDTGDWQEARVDAYSAEEGDALWSWEAGGNITGLAVGDGTVYAVATDGTLTAIDAETGALQWASEIDGGSTSISMFAGPSIIVAPSLVAALTSRGTVAVLDRENGDIAWTDDGYDPNVTMLAATRDQLIVTTRPQLYPVPGPTPQFIELPYEATPPVRATPISASEDYIADSWKVSKLDLATGVRYGTGGVTELTGVPAALGDVAAVPGRSFDRSRGQGMIFGLFGLSAHTGGQVTVDLPEAITGKRITQLGTWTPPDGAPDQFVVVTEDGVLALVDPKHVGVVDDADAPNPYDGAIVDLGQPVISAPVGDENGVWIVLADGTLAEIHPNRLNQELQQTQTASPEASPLPTTVGWQLDPPESGTGFHTVTETLLDQTLYRLVVLNGVDGSAHWVQAIDVANGEVRWERRFLNGGFEMVVNEDALAMVTMHRSLAAYSVVVLDADSGDQRWQAELAGSPELVGGPVLSMTDRQLLALTADGWLEAFDLGTGEIDFALPLVNSTDLASSPLKILPIVDPSRFALDGDTLAVVVGDGSVVGVDLTNDWIIWRVVQNGIGANAVYAIDGQFVVVAVKGLAASATPGVPTRIPLTAPLTASDCDRFISSGSASDATPIARDQDAAMELLGIDAQSGDVQWRGWASEPVEATVWTWAGDDTFEMVVSPSSEWPRDGSSAIVCAVDAATGAVTYRGDQMDTTMSTLTFRSLEAGQFFEVRIFQPGYGFAFPIDAPSVTGPSVEIDAAVEEISQVTKHGDWVYLTLTDGRLIQVADQA